MVKNKVVADMAKKVMKKLREEVEKIGLKLSVNENGQEAKEQHVRVAWFLGGRAASMQEGRSDDGKQCGNTWSDLRTKTKRLGNVRFSLIKKNKAFQKSYMKVVVKKSLRAGMVPARTWGAHAVGIAAHRQNLRRQQVKKKHDLDVFVNGSIWL